MMEHLWYSFWRNEKCIVSFNVEFSVGFEVLTAVDMNVAKIYVVAPCSPYVNRRFGGTYHPPILGKKTAEQEASMQQLSRK
jgi:hypothetical protein